jgi:DNA polymerase III subunit beta
MKFTIQREALLKPLQQVVGAVERRHTMPMLGHVLLSSTDFGMTMTATDLELELVAEVHTATEVGGATTLPARKLLDICRALPESAEVSFDINDGKASIRSLRSRFVLATLPAADFPSLQDIRSDYSLRIAQRELKRLIDRTAFAMAQQDVRYYLNGLLLHVQGSLLRTVATDGHRLATCEIASELHGDATRQVIIPRKAVQELQRLLADSDQEVEVELSANHIRVNVPELQFTSKLIDGRYPDYERVLPRESTTSVCVDRQIFRQALIRAAILSSEKYRGVRLSLDDAGMKLQAHNPDQEEAEEFVEVSYQGSPLEIGFNVNYLLDVLNAIESDDLELKLKDANSSALLKVPNSDQLLYVIMPMRL